MKKKWIVIPSLLVLTVLIFGAYATVPLWGPLWDEIRPGPKVVVDGTMRAQAIDTLVAKLNAFYIFPDKAKQIEARLRQRQHDGKYDGMTDGEQLANQLTDDIHSAVPDRHMVVRFSRGLVPPDDPGPPPAGQADWEKRTNFATRVFVRATVRLMHYGVKKVDRLDSNIGYLQISSFPPDFLVAGKYAEMMDELADTDGLIVDLRDNGGGLGETSDLLISYFVDQRTRLNDVFDREPGATTQHWTIDKLDGKRYGGKKPVVILTGPGTMSAAEDFTYTMQALKRATVIGGPTWGGANPARPQRLGDHFLAVIPDRLIINPVTHANWEGAGVVPDVAAAPDKALEAAKELLQRQLHGASPSVASAR